MSYQAAVITVRDRASAGVYEDKSGPAVAAMLKEAGYEVVYTKKGLKRESALQTRPPAANERPSNDGH